MNWEDDGQEDKDGTTLKQEGLKSRLTGMNLNCPVEMVKIPDGSSEKEIWEIFNIIFGKIDKDDELIFDITHGFRSLPMLALVIINYAKLLKKITISGIFYGAFETLGSSRQVEKLNIEKINAPIFDLTPFVKLIEWTKAVGDFLDFGDAREICRLTETESVPIIKEKKNNKDEAVLLKKFSESLNKFSYDIGSSRGKNIQDFKYFSGFDLKDFLSKDTFIDPFNPLIEKILSKIESFKPDSIQNGYAAVQWCLEHILIQQGYTIFLETMISEIAAKHSREFLETMNHLEKDNPEKNKNPSKTLRILVSQSLNISSRKELKFDVTKWSTPASQYPEIVKKIINQTSQEFLKIYDSLTGRRNDVNHASFNDNSVSAAKLKDDLEKTFNQFMEMKNNHNDLGKIN
jgi:CRISPR-associated Csx2 family protein